MPKLTTEVTAMEDTEAMAVTAMARGLLMLRLHQLLRPSPRLMPTTAMAGMVLVMVVTDTARGLLMPTMEATAMEAMAATAMARGLLMPRPTMEATAMVATEAMAMEDTEAMAATAMARGPPMPKLITEAMAMARGPLMPTTAAAMAVTVMAVMAMASKSQNS